jgi:hypothetical protein
MPFKGSAPKTASTSGGGYHYTEPAHNVSQINLKQIRPSSQVVARRHLLAKRLTRPLLSDSNFKESVPFLLLTNPPGLPGRDPTLRERHCFSGDKE